jgi:hypothetical protein
MPAPPSQTRVCNAALAYLGESRRINSITTDAARQAVLAGVGRSGRRGPRRPSVEPGACARRTPVSADLTCPTARNTARRSRSPPTACAGCRGARTIPIISTARRRATISSPTPTAPIVVRYIARIDDIAKWSPGMRAVLAAKLARKLAKPITGQTVMMDRCRKPVRRGAERGQAPGRRGDRRARPRPGLAQQLARCAQPHAGIGARGRAVAPSANGASTPASCPAHARPRRPGGLSERARRNGRLAAAAAGAGGGSAGNALRREGGGPCRLFPFEFVPTQGYVIEASASSSASTPTTRGSRPRPASLRGRASLQLDELLAARLLAERGRDLSRRRRQEAAEAVAHQRRRPSRWSTSTSRTARSRSATATRRSRLTSADDGGNVTITPARDLRADRRRRRCSRSNARTSATSRVVGAGGQGHRRRPKLKWGGNVYQVELSGGWLHRRRPARA